MIQYLQSIDTAERISFVYNNQIKWLAISFQENTKTGILSQKLSLFVLVQHGHHLEKEINKSKQ